MTYTAWQASDLATVLACRQPTDYERAQAEQMLRAYAADLDRRAEGVTDEAVERACAAFMGEEKGDWADYSVFPGDMRKDMRTALLAVWPVAAEPVAHTGTDDVVVAACRVFSNAYTEHMKGSPRRAGATYAGIAAVLAAQPRALPDDVAKRLERIERAARSVVAWDWSDNDPDCVEDIERLRAAIDAVDKARMESVAASPAQPADSGRVTDEMCRQALRKLPLSAADTPLDMVRSAIYAALEAALAAQGQGRADDDVPTDAVYRTDGLRDKLIELFYRQRNRENDAELADGVIALLDQLDLDAQGQGDGERKASPEHQNEMLMARMALQKVVVPPAWTAGVPEGWKLVPREPTESMIHAGAIWCRDGAGNEPSVKNQCTAANSYRAMLAAAPSAQESQPNG